LSTAIRDLVAVGRIVKVFGVKGDVIVTPMTDVPGRFKDLRRVFLGNPSSAPGEEVRETTITHVHAAPRGIRVTLECAADRTTAEQLVGLLILVPPAERATLPAGTYFVDDLLGLAVRTEDGERVGVLKEVMHMPAHDVYVIDTGGEEVLLPAVREFVLGVDLHARTLTVKLIEGMRT
jgi:16S rRNA processing protein RimM